MNAAGFVDSAGRFEQLSTNAQGVIIGRIPLGSGPAREPQRL